MTFIIATIIVRIIGRSFFSGNSKPSWYTNVFVGYMFVSLSVEVKNIVWSQANGTIPGVSGINSVVVVVRETGDHFPWKERKKIRAIRCQTRMLPFHGNPIRFRGRGSDISRSSLFKWFSLTVTLGLKFHPKFIPSQLKEFLVLSSLFESTTKQRLPVRS